MALRYIVHGTKGPNQPEDLEMEATGGLLKLGFGLSGGCSYVTDLVRRTELDCPHAMGIDAVSAQRAESFRHFLLLPSPHSTPSLRSVA